MPANYHNRKTTLSVFLSLTVVFAVLILTASSLTDIFARSILVSLGCAIFGAGLTYFLIRFTGRE